MINVLNLPKFPYVELWWELRKDIQHWRSFGLDGLRKLKGMLDVMRWLSRDLNMELPPEFEPAQQYAFFLEAEEKRLARAARKQGRPAKVRGRKAIVRRKSLRKVARAAKP